MLEKRRDWFADIETIGPIVITVADLPIFIAKAHQMGGQRAIRWA